jgi:hypothetical protein
LTNLSPYAIIKIQKRKREVKKMKVSVKVIEEKVYEVELTPEEYLHFRANFSQNYPMHDRVLTEGKVVDSSREWVKITNLEPEDLDDYFFNKK